jgi:hypothetical protein
MLEADVTRTTLWEPPAYLLRADVPPLEAPQWLLGAATPPLGATSPPGVEPPPWGVISMEL